MPKASVAFDEIGWSSYSDTLRLHEFGSKGRTMGASGEAAFVTHSLRASIGMPLQSPTDSTGR